MRDLQKKGKTRKGSRTKDFRNSGSKDRKKRFPELRAKSARKKGERGRRSNNSRG